MRLRWRVRPAPPLLLALIGIAAFTARGLLAAAQPHTPEATAASAGAAEASSAAPQPRRASSPALPLPASPKLGPQAAAEARKALAAARAAATSPVGMTVGRLHGLSLEEEILMARLSGQVGLRAAGARARDGAAGCAALRRRWARDSSGLEAAGGARQQGPRGSRAAAPIP
jgi:hypothetical protein